MEKNKNHFKGIKIFGIDWIIIVTNEPRYFKSAGTVRNTIIMDLHTTTSIRRDLKELIRSNSSSVDSIIIASDSPDALRALKKSGAAMLIGLYREGSSRKDLYHAGAEYVAESLSELTVVEGMGGPFRFTQELPGAFQFLNREALTFLHRNPVFFFDYDGTLSPIVKDPKKAHLSTSLRILLKKISENYTVAIVSGRDLRDVREFVQVDNLIYAGSHGFRIAGPGGISWTHSEAEKTIPILDKVEKSLSKKFANQPGIMVERKYSALAIHYRNAPKHSYKEINQVVSEMIRNIPDLRKGRGKKIVEIKPAFEWNKGKAVEWILRKTGSSDPEEFLPVYIGDDLTDEDAFRALADHGTSILVGDHGQASAADMKLRDCSQVEELLHVLVQKTILEKEKGLSFSYL